MTINAGGIAFYDYNADGTDGFSFMVLEDIPSGEVLHFTDTGVDSSDVFIGLSYPADKFITWTNNTGGPIPVGTTVTYVSGVGFSVGQTTPEAGTTNPSDGISVDLSLSSLGDSIIAFQGTEASPTFIAMIHMNGDYDSFSGNNTGSSNSYLPSTLTDGVNALSINTEIDNAAYTGPTTPTDADGWRARLNDESNWSGDNSNIVTSSLDSIPSVTVTCFLAGAMITTPMGETCVEDLKIGDMILSAAGKSLPVKWIGRQTVIRQRHSYNMQPVRIRAGALGKDLPRIDLTVTADHGMVIDEYVVNASVLVNGDTIDFVPISELENSFTVYHIETENHDVILANGAASESFVDAVGRAAFDNYQEYLELYGVERIIPEMDHPRIASQRLLPTSLKNRLGICDTAQAVIMALGA